MTFERGRGHSGGTRWPSQRSRERTEAEQADAARMVVVNIEQTRALVEARMDELDQSSTAADWHAARTQLDSALSRLERLLDGASSHASHADPDTATRLREVEAARTELVERAAAHLSPPAFTQPALSCEAALLAALPPDQMDTGGGPIKALYEAAESSVAEVVATISPAETAIVIRRLRDPADPLGRRFGRFSADRREKLLALLRSRKRLVALTTGKRPEAPAVESIPPVPAPAELPHVQPAAQDAELAYAIVRIEEARSDERDWAERVTIERIVWSDDVARPEVERLNRLHAGTGRRYFSQRTRVDPKERR